MNELDRRVENRELRLQPPRIIINGEGRGLGVLEECFHTKVTVTRGVEARCKLCHSVEHLDHRVVNDFIGLLGGRRRTSKK